MKIIRSKEKKEITKKLNEEFGIENIEGTMLKFGKERTRLYTGNLDYEQLKKLDDNLHVETIGIYFLKEEKGELRISFDSVYLFKNQIKKNLLNIDDEAKIEWLKGNDIKIKTEKGLKMIENNNELLGCGKSTGEDIKNFVPKERRIN